MRVAIITNGGIGGGNNNQGLPFLTNLVESLAEECEIDVFSFAPNGGIQPSKYNVQSISGTITQPSFLKLLKMIFLFSRSHRVRQYDVLHSIWPYPSGFTTVLLGKIYRVQSIVSMQGGGLVNIPAIKYGGNRTWLQRLLNNWTLTNATRLTTLTSFLETFIPTQAQKEKNTVIYYGVDTNRFQYKAHEITEPIQFIHVANISAVKDQETLLRCFKVISQQVNCKLTIAGSDYYKEGVIQQLLNDLELTASVDFLDFVPHQEIPHLLAKADIMLHTSMHEGMGVVLAEAMACGVLVCGTKVGLLADLPSDCCIAVPVKSYNELANNVLELLQDVSRMNEMRRNGYHWIRKNTHKTCVEKYIKIYKELA